MAFFDLSDIKVGDVLFLEKWHRFDNMFVVVYKDEDDLGRYRCVSHSGQWCTIVYHRPFVTKQYIKVLVDCGRKTCVPLKVSKVLIDDRIVSKPRHKRCSA